MDDPDSVPSQRWSGWVQTSWVILPMLVVVAIVARKPWAPVSDQAFTLMRTLDVGGRHTPLVGVYSRFDFNHPGPAMFYLFAPFTRLLGPAGMLVATGLLNAFAIGGTVAVVRRRTGVAGGVAIGVLVLTLCHSMGTERWIDPWNPWVAFFPFLFAVVCAWGAIDGDEWCLPLFVGSASFVLQCHVGYLPLVSALAAVIALLLVVFHRAELWPSFRRGRSVLLVSAAVAIVMWLPPVVQQLRGRPGNLTLIWDYLVAPKEVIGMRAAARIMAAELTPTGSWLTGLDNRPRFLPVAPIGWLAVIFVVVAALTLLAHRRHLPALARMGMLAFVLNAAAIVTTARIQGVPANYVIRWSWAIAGITWFFVVVTSLELVRAVLMARWSRASTFGAVTPTARSIFSVAVVGVFALALLPASVGVTVPDKGRSDSVIQLTHLVEPHLDRSHTYLIKAFSVDTLYAIDAAVGVELERKGFRVYWAPDPRTEMSVGPGRILDPPSQADATLYLWGVPGSVDDFATPSGYRTIVRFDPRTPAEVRERARLKKIYPALIASALKSKQGTPESKRIVAEAERVSERLDALQEKGVGYVVGVKP